MTTQRRAVPMAPLIGAMVVGAAVTGVMVWRLTLTAIDAQIAAKTSAMKKMVLSGKIPPNEEVMEYLTMRQQALEQRYQRWKTRVAAATVAEAASADPQLYFQEQLHDVQRTLERLATARAMAVPEQLGFPKELPPADTVPQLLIQLSLIKEAAALMFEQGVAALSSFKIEDAQPVPQPDDEAEPFLTRLPVRVRLHATLPQLMKVLGALQRVSPLVDVLVVRAAPGGASNHLEVELVLSRYLVTAQTLEPPRDDDAASATPARGAKDRKAPSGSKRKPADE